MADVDDLFLELKSYIEELTGKFVSKYVPADPTTQPSAYEHDVRAYCVLCHAAFEDFVERVVLLVASHSVDAWTNSRKPSHVVACLLCWHGAVLNIDTDENASETKPFDYIRPLLESAKGAFSKEVHKNHGISITYLRSLLIPVAMEVPQDANLLNSLKKLTDGRGSYAHKGRVKSVLAPEDAKRYVDDVLTLCDDIRAKAGVKLA